MKGDVFSQRTLARADEIFQDRKRQIHWRIDCMFAVLMIVQWVGAVVAALCLSPRTWAGSVPSIHPHVWLAFVAGGALTSLPVWMAWRYPGATVTRYVIAVAQVLFSSLLIQVTGGRLETHFHIFGSLAFLAAYRDRGLLAVATAVVAADHFIRGVFWPESIFGVATADEWRWVEHSGWVLFEDLFLFITIRKSTEEMEHNALQTALFEKNHEDLKNYSDRLHRSFEKERSIIEGSLDVVIELDSVGAVLNWSRHAERLFGWSSAEAIGHRFDELAIPHDDRRNYLDGLERLAQSPAGSTHRQQFEMECVDRRGRIFAAELAVVAIEGADETTFCAFVRDVTERKSHERDIRRAMEEAEAANRIKGEFLANMSHEIRTPLNGILGFAELLVRGVDDDPRARCDYAETIRTSARHLLELLNNVLDLSKIESGKMQVERTRFSPHQMIAEVVSLLRVRAAEKGIVLDYRWDGPIPESIVSDPHRLRQLLINLVGNAIKFTEQGSVMIVASTGQTDDGSRLLLEVRDTGIGIAVSKLDDVFQPFVQADSSMTRRYGGTGLGLAICKNIAAALDGELTVESEEGKGTTFKATIAVGDLRRVKMLSVPPTSTTGDYVDACPTTANLQGVRVLLADDGETNRKLLQVFLARHGVVVETVENGEMACRLALDEPFDVVLMDMQMPRMDGYAATRKLRSLGFNKPIIALTAHAMKGDREKCTYAGCSGYLAKPVNVDDLIREVQAAVGVGSSRVRDSAAEKERKVAKALSESIRSSLPTEDELLREVVAEFVESIPDRLTAMEQALASQDYEELRRLAHGLKGSGGTAGFACLTEVSAELELVVADQRADQASALLSELREIGPRITV